MSGLHIIELSVKGPIPKEERISEDSLVDDYTVNYYTDYLRGELNDEERKKAIGQIKKDLEDVATVDEDKETITFLPAEDVERVKKEYMRHALIALATKLKAGTLRAHDLRMSGAEFGRTNDLVTVDLEGARCISSLIDDVCYPEMPRTYHIGAIISAHI